MVVEISIIVPCYKAEDVLPCCVKSILSQTFSAWELWLINDGSPDSTGCLCDCYAEKDNRIHVLHKENGGVSSARNAGIEMAQGAYITFVDADDTIEPFYLEKLIAGRHSDFTLCGFKSSKGINFIPEALFLEKADLRERIEWLVENDYLLYSPWCKLFSNSIIKLHHLLFDSNIRLGEDTIFCYQYLLLCKNIKIISSNGYNYDGIWGGGDKYKLRKKEVEYLDKVEIDTIRRINNYYGCNIDITYRGFHVGMLDGLYEKFTDKNLYEMYVASHGYISIDDFYSKRQLSYVFWGIVKLESLYMQRNYKEGKTFMKVLNHFFTLSGHLLKRHPHKMRAIHWCIQARYYTLTHILLYFTTKLKQL